MAGAGGVDLGGQTVARPAWPASSPGPARWWSATPGRRTWPPPSARRWSACSPRPSRSDSGAPTGCPPSGWATPPPPAGTPGPPAARCPGTPACRRIDPGSVRGARSGCSACPPDPPPAGPRPPGPPAGGGSMNILLWHVHGSWTTVVRARQTPLPRAGHPRPGPVRAGPGPHLPLAGHAPSRSPRTGCAAADVDLVAPATARGVRPGRPLAGPAGRPGPAGDLRRAQHPQGATCRTAGTRWPTGTTC